MADDNSLNAASLSLSVIGLVALFDICIKGCSFVSKATTVDNRGQITLSKFEIETWRLAVWGRMWGLIDESPTQSPNHNLNILDIRRIVNNCLVAIRQMVGDMEVLEQKYGLRTEIGAVVNDSGPTVAMPDNFGSTHPLDHTAVVEAYARWLDEAAQRRKEFTLLKRVHFTFADHDKFLGLVQDLAYFVKKLYDMLPVDQFRQYQRAYTAECLGRATSDQALSNAQLATDEHLRRHAGNQLLARRIERAAISEPSSDHEKKYNQRSLDINQVDRNNLRRCLAKLIPSSTPSRISMPIPVFVEWKTGNWDSTLRPVMEKRVDNLTTLLSKVRSDDEGQFYRVLECIGYFEDPRPNTFGIFYQLPPRADPMREPLSLYDRLALKAPSLDVRFEMAKKLAVSLNELHSSGWLHKNIRSQNVVFFHTDSNSHSQVGSSGADESDEAMLAQPYLVGFEFSRPNIDTRGTEDKHPLGGAGSAESFLDIYRHPSQSWSFSRREHDIYSLGLVLLELGYWQRLDDAREDEQSLGDFHATIQTCADDLHIDAGNVYRDVVKRCLALDGNVWTAAQPIYTPANEGDGEPESSVEQAQQSEDESQGRVLRDFYFSVVEKLVNIKI